MINYLLLIFYSLFIFSFENEKSTLSAKATDPYLVASFSSEKELDNLLLTEAISRFSADFDSKFEDNFNSDLQYEKLNIANVDDWEMQLFEQRNNQMMYLRDHESFSELPSEFIELMQVNITYNYWHMLLAFSINKSNENTGLPTVTSLPQIMTESLEFDKVNNPKRLISKSYRAFLPYFVIYFNSKDRKFKKYADGVLSISDKATFASKYLDGNVLDYTLTVLLEQNHITLSTSSFRFWTSQIYCQNLQNYLSENYFEAVLAAENSREERLTNSQNNKNQLPSILDLSDKAFTFEKYKGKVIYVDFWASWCGPCRKEFPFSKRMHEGLNEKQKKNLVFLYISIDEDLEKWRAAVQKLGLHEFGENGHSFEVSRAYMVSSIPRYMIIDQKGNIINDRATRPSNPETLQTLLELIK